MRLRIDVNTMDGKLSFEKDARADALEVARSFADKGNLGVTITNTKDQTTYALQDFDKLLRKVGEV